MGGALGYYTGSERRAVDTPYSPGSSGEGLHARKWRQTPPRNEGLGSMAPLCRANIYRCEQYPGCPFPRVQSSLITRGATRIQCAFQPTAAFTTKGSYYYNSDLVNSKLTFILKPDLQLITRHSAIKASMDISNKTS